MTWMSNDELKMIDINADPPIEEIIKIPQRDEEGKFQINDDSQ